MAHVPAVAGRCICRVVKYGRPSDARSWNRLPWSMRSTQSRRKLPVSRTHCCKEVHRHWHRIQWIEMLVAHLGLLLLAGSVLREQYLEG